MSSTPDKNKPRKAAARKRRRYNSPLRQQQSARTRQRIVAAGRDLVHELPTWNWKRLTYRVVAERAGVSERTVHRYFSTERELRDAVLEGVVEESGVRLDKLQLKDFASVTASLFAFLPTFAAETENEKDPTLASIDQQRREALLQAVVQATPDWSDRERETAAAALDVLWNPPTYERLVVAWGLDTAKATCAVTWLIGLIEAAIANGERPKTVK
jgi:AcrR family transcriptional regulator